MKPIKPIYILLGALALGALIGTSLGSLIVLISF